jgi:hypothetical protein
MDNFKALAIRGGQIARLGQDLFQWSRTPLIW